MPEYPADPRVSDKALCAAYDSHGVQGVFDKFGTGGLYRLFRDWHTGGYSFVLNNSSNEVRIKAIHESWSEQRIRDLCVSVSVSSSSGGGGGELYSEEDLHRFEDLLRNARAGASVDESIVGGLGVSTRPAHLRHKGSIMVQFGNTTRELDLEEAHELERALARALAEVQLYSTLKKHAELLLGEN